MANIPLDIKLWQKTGMVDLIYVNGEKFSLSTDYLRQQSTLPSSAENNTVIIGLEIIDNHGLSFFFNDANSVVYEWDYLYSLAFNCRDNVTKDANTQNAIKISKNVIT